MRLETAKYLQKYYGLTEIDDDPITQLEGYFVLAMKKKLFPVAKCDCGRYSDARLDRCPFCNDNDYVEENEFELKNEQFSPKELSEIYGMHPAFEFDALEQQIRDYLLDIERIYIRVADCLTQINERDLWKKQRKNKRLVYKSIVDWSERVFSIPHNITKRLLMRRRRYTKYFQIGPMFAGNYWNAVDVVENKLNGNVALMPVKLGVNFYDVKIENDCEVFDIQFGAMIKGRVCVFSRRDGSKAASFRLVLNDDEIKNNK
jgi:hypothetical protein